MFLEIKFTENLLLLFQNLLKWKQIRVLWNLNYQYGIVVAETDSCIGREERDKRNRLPVVPYQIYFKGKKMKVIAPRRG